MLKEKDAQFNALTPGLLVEAKILSRKPQGLTVSVGKLNAYVHVTHLSQHVKDYSVDKPVRLTLSCDHDSI